MARNEHSNIRLGKDAGHQRVDGITLKQLMGLLGIIGAVAAGILLYASTVPTP